MSKVKNGTVPPLLEEVFQIANPNYNLRNKRNLNKAMLKRSPLAQSLWLFVFQKYGIASNLFEILECIG